MDKKEIETMIADVKNAIEETREINKRNKQEEAMMEKPTMNNEQSIFADVQSAMKEGRAITLGNTNGTSVANTIAKGLVEKSDFLSRFSITAGGNASQIIPVFSSEADAFSPVDENGSFSNANDAMVTINLQPHAYARGLKISDYAYRLSAVDFGKEIKELVNGALTKTILNKVFNGTGSDGFKKIHANPTEVTTSTWTAKDLHDFVMKNVATKSDNAVIMMNPTQYAALADATGNKDKILMEQILNKNLEGMEIIVSNYVPADVYAIATPLSNYGIGIADELRIEEKKTINSLAHQFDASAYLCGAPIVEKDVFVLKASL